MPQLRVSGLFVLEILILFVSNDSRSEDHIARECDQPRDVSTITCRNCDESEFDPLIQCLLRNLFNDLDF
jgi:hypothetical protein